MKLFQQRPEVQKFNTMREFAEAFSLGTGDFILVSRSIYDLYMKALNIKAEIHFKSDYGKGEPTDEMVNALLADLDVYKRQTLHMVTVKLRWIW